jgi:hypothetical protein
MAGVFMGPTYWTGPIIEAGRAMAWRDGVDCDAMENLLRKVSTTAYRRAIDGFLHGAANDEETP